MSHLEFRHICMRSSAAPRHRQAFKERCSRLYLSDAYFGPILTQLRAQANNTAAAADPNLPKTARLDSYELRGDVLYFRSHRSQALRLTTANFAIVSCSKSTTRRREGIPELRRLCGSCSINPTGP